MEISTKAKNKASELISVLFDDVKNKNKKYFSDFLDEHFHYSRYYGSIWKSAFNKQIIKEFDELTFKNEQMKSDLLSVFNYQTKLNDIHIKRISEIIQLRKVSPTFFNSESDLNPVHFLIDYKSYIMSKHIYSCIFHFLRFKNFSKQKNIFNSINSHSLTGNVFHFENEDIYFSIPINKAPCFVFYHDKKILGIDSNMSPNCNSLFLIPHFLFIHQSYDNDYKKLREKFKDIHQKKLPILFKEVSNDNILSDVDFKNMVNKNINYVLCYENETQYHNISLEDYITMNILAIEKPTLAGFEVPSNVYRIIYNHIINSASYFDLSLDRRDFSISFIMSYLSSGNINNLKNKLSKKESGMINKIIINKLSMIIKDIDNDSYELNDFKKACLKNQILNNDISEALYLFFIKHKSFYSFFKKNQDIGGDSIIKFRESICKKYIENLIIETTNNDSNIDMAISNILAINPSANAKKIKNKLKKITK